MNQPMNPTAAETPTARPQAWPRRISWLAAGLVALLALLAFSLSYSSLRELALANGVGPWLSYIWPLLLDFSMVVCSVVILRASLRGEPATWPWVLTGIYTFLATLGNILDVTSLWIPPVVVQAGVKALAALTCFVTFELLMSMVRAEVKRAQGQAVVQVDLRPAQPGPEGQTEGADAPTVAGTQAQPVEPVAQPEPDPGPRPEPVEGPAVAHGGEPLNDRQATVLALAQQGLGPTAIAKESGIPLTSVKRTLKGLNGRVTG